MIQEQLYKRRRNLLTMRAMRVGFAFTHTPKNYDVPRTI